MFCIKNKKLKLSVYSPGRIVVTAVCNNEIYMHLWHACTEL